MSAAPIIDQLTGWARDTYGGRAVVTDVRRMPGNSGLSYGFNLVTPHRTEPLVIRMPPTGVAQRGNADVLHQVRILRAMAAQDIPVPEVRYAHDDNPWFDVPFYVSTLVQGESTHLFDPERALRHDGRGLKPVFVDGMHTLAAIHRVDWREHLPGWSEPRGLHDEIGTWMPTLRSCRDAATIATGEALADRLSSVCPAAPEPTLVHGDFYSNNWLFADGRLTAVLDWEISGIGGAGLDLGWICMMHDDRSWGHARHRWRAWEPNPQLLVREYANAGGRLVDDLPFYRALAGYKLFCITARNHMLHRTGRRVDPAWEVLADALPAMARRANELLSP